MKVSIGIGWFFIIPGIGYLARGWDGAFGALLIMFLLSFGVMPLMAVIVKRKYGEK